MVKNATSHISTSPYQTRWRQSVTLRAGSDHHLLEMLGNNMAKKDHFPKRKPKDLEAKNWWFVKKLVSLLWKNQGSIFSTGSIYSMLVFSGIEFLIGWFCGFTPPFGGVTDGSLFPDPRNFHDLAELRERAWETQLLGDDVDRDGFAAPTIGENIYGCFRK